jgi:SAM-dependent methyltransferase
MRPSGPSDFSCRRCQRNLSRRDGILVDSALPADVQNRLETIDYDQTHGVSAEASEQLGAGYAAFIRPNFAPDRLTNLTILEIGSGSGVLSLGLALAFSFQRMVVSDLSPTFMAVNRRRMHQLLPPDRISLLKNRIEFLTCSINDLPFVSNGLDLIVGNSVLHHIYDFEAALRALRQKLRPGGLVVLSEPVIQGKVPIGLACRLIYEIDRLATAPKFNAAELKLLRDMATMCTRGFWRVVGEASRDTADDKHLFDVHEIAALGQRTGFAEAKAVSVLPVADSLAGQMRSTFLMTGIRTDSLEFYNYVIDAITEQVLLEMPDAFCANHAFLSFRKSD